MPGYIMHLTEAAMICDRLLDFSHINSNDAKTWKQQFQYGALLPDAAKSFGKKKSHFWREADMDQIVIAPDLEIFMEQYRADHSDPLTCGYLAHLHLDQCFFGRYFDYCVEFIDEKGIPQKQFQKIHSARIRKNQEVLSLERFFSDEYLYGDYTKLNHYLIQKYKLKIPVYPSQVPECRIKEVRFEDLREVLKKLDGFIQEGYDCQNEELKVFPTQGKTLERFLEETAEVFTEELLLKTRKQLFVRS